MLPLNSTASLAPASRSDSLNPKENTIGSDAIDNIEMEEAWFDAVDYIAIEEDWFDACGSYHVSPADAGETAESRVPFTEDCRRGVQQLIRTLAEYGESKMLSACLSNILPGTPTSLVVAANSLYIAITEHRNIDTAALHALGLASWFLPDNINIVSQLAAFIRETVTDWTDKTFLQQFLGEDENHASSSLFLALAITAIVAGRWVKDEGAPQRGLLKVPAFLANIFIQASHYWNALGNMARILPASGEMLENIESPRRAPAFKVETLVKTTQDACVGSVAGLPSSVQITALSSNSTVNPEACARGTVQNKPFRGSYRLTVPEQAHYLVVDKLRQESGLSNLFDCTTRKTETCQQTQVKAVTATHFNSECDAIAYPEPLMKEAESTPYIDKPETQISSSATSRSGGDALLPLVAAATTLPIATSYLKALKSKSVLAAGSTLLAVGGVALWSRVSSLAESNADKAVAEGHRSNSDRVKEEESIIPDCNCINKCNEADYSDELYNNYSISNMPRQTEFLTLYTQPRNEVKALLETNQAMASITGESPPKQYNSIEDLKRHFKDHQGKILTRRIENALTEVTQRIKNAYLRLIDPAEKKDILSYLSAALKTDHEYALDEAYERLRRTAFQTFTLVKNNVHSISFFERRDKSKTFSGDIKKTPMVLVNRKNPRLIKINLESVDNRLSQLLVKQSSAGYNPELVDEFMRQMIMLGGDTQDLVSLQRCKNEDGLFLGTYQQALQDFANEKKHHPELMKKWSLYPDDTTVIDVLNKMHNVTITNEMRQEAKNKLNNPDDEYYQRKTGKSNPTETDKIKIRNAITWSYTGSVQDFKITQFFNDPIYRADRMTANTDSATIYLRDIGAKRNQTSWVEDNPTANKFALEFIHIAQELRNNFSDPKKVARDIAKNKVYQRTGQTLDPDNVFLHQFRLAQTIKDSACYTGYAHNGTPLYSETLTEAYMDNFKIFRKRQSNAFINAINRAAASAAGNGYLPPQLDDPELTAPFFTSPERLSGLYLVNASANHFDAKNEIKYLPSDLKNDIYDANVMKQLEDLQTQFWTENVEAWRAMAKGQFIAEARLALLNNSISQQAYEILIKGGAANIVLYDPLTMQELKETAAADPSVEVAFLNVIHLTYSAIEPDPYELFYKSDILCFTGEDGREVLYVTGDKHSFREFKNAQELGQWLKEQIKNIDGRTALLQHFSLADRQNEVEELLIDFAEGKKEIDILETLVLETGIVKKNIREQFNTDDVFSALTQLTIQRTKDDADTLINSNGEVVLQSAQQILQVVNMLAMPLLPVLGPVGSVLDIGLSLAQLNIDIGVILTADSPEERNNALSNAGLGLLFLGISSASALKSSRPSGLNMFPTHPSSRQVLLETNIAILQKHPGYLKRLQVLKENGLSGRGSIKAGQNWRQQGKQSLGEDLDFRWIDDEAAEMEKTLQTQLFSKGVGAAKLREFRNSPKNLCYEAMVESFNALTNQGEHPKAVGLLIYKNPRDEAPLNHFAVFIRKDSADFIVDPTIHKFDASLSESATVLPIADWKKVMQNKAGIDKDTVIILSSFDTPLQARQTVADLHSAKGKYYQSSLIKKDNVDILKEGNGFENSIIQDLETIKNELRTLPTNSAKLQDVKQDLANLEALKERFALLSPQEIKVTHCINAKTKRLLAQYAIPEEEVTALKSAPHHRGIIDGFSAKKYIKISKDSYVVIQVEPHGDSAWVIVQGQKKIFMKFDDVKNKWIIPEASAIAKDSDRLPLNVVKSDLDSLAQHSNMRIGSPKKSRLNISNTKIVKTAKQARTSAASWQRVAMINHSDLPESTRLSQISMLGSHDAGTYAYSGFKSMGAIFPFAFKTQKINLREQAMAGARYFDIRVAERVDGSFGFFHGPSITEGDAVAAVRDLLNYAKEDAKNFFLIKFVFKEDKIRDVATKTSSDKFLQQVLEGHRNHLITQKDTPNLATARVSLLNKHKNLAIMVDKYHGSERHWSYHEQVYTKWANQADAQKTANFIKEFHRLAAPENKLTIIQTNMPFASVKNKAATISVESYLYKNCDIIASAVDEISNPGIVIGDYIGAQKGPAEKFKTKINADNNKLIIAVRP